MTRSRFALLAGVAGVVTYLAGALLTGALDPGLARPLLDGRAPPAPYRWVHPPRIPGIQFANEPPAKASSSIRLTTHGSRVAIVATSDSQFSALLDTGAVPAKAGQRTSKVTIDPVDATTLGPPPAGLQIAGNAYKVAATYQPGGAPVPTFHGANGVALQYPLLALSGAGSASSTHTLLYSTDGRTWRRQGNGGVDTKPAQAVYGSLTAPGYYAVAAPAAAKTGGIRRYLLLGVFLTAAAVVIAMIAFSYQARRTQHRPRRH